MIPTSAEIAYFLELYQTKHVSRAAMRLGITQPTLTISLKRIEEKLGVSLFYRTKQGMIPTPSAVSFYARAKSLIECWGEIRDIVGASKNEIEGTFRVGCHQSVGAFTTPTLFRNLTLEAPRISINLVHDFSRKITERIVSYDIDIGYVVNPPKHPDLVLKKIATDKLAFWKKRGVQNLPKRIFANGNRKQVEELLGKTYSRYFQGWHIVESSSLELIRTLTHLGLGIGVIPERVANADAMDLVLFDKDLPTRPDEIFLAYRKEVLASKAGRELLRLATFHL